MQRAYSARLPFCQVLISLHKKFGTSTARAIFRASATEKLPVRFRPPARYSELFRRKSPYFSLHNIKLFVFLRLSKPHIQRHIHGYIHFPRMCGSCLARNKRFDFKSFAHYAQFFAQPPCWLLHASGVLSIYIIYFFSSGQIVQFPHGRTPDEAQN